METQGALDQASLGLNYRTPKMRTSQSEKAVWESAKDFEAVFISSMLQPVFDSIETDGLFGGGQGEKVFRGLMVQEYGKQVANSGGIGIAEKVYEVMLKAQENR